MSRQSEPNPILDAHEAAREWSNTQFPSGQHPNGKKPVMPPKGNADDD